MATAARLAVILFAVGALALASGSVRADASVGVSLGEWWVDGDAATAEEGEITFQVANDGRVAHNFIVIRTDLAPNALPLDETGYFADESQLDVVGKTSEMQAACPTCPTPRPEGESATLTVGLPPGNYVLICNNLEGHYTAGMYQGFTVTAAPQEPTATFVPGQPTPTPGQPTNGGTPDGTTPDGQTSNGGVPSVGSGPEEQPTENWWALPALAVAGAALIGLGALTHRWAQQQR